MDRGNGYTHTSLMELLNQWMFTIVHPGEAQEFLHIVTDIFPLFPYHSDLYADGWTEGNSFYAGRGKFAGHAGIEKASIFTGFYQLQNSINLAAVHDDVRDVTAHFEACFQQLVLYGIGIKKD